MKAFFQEIGIEGTKLEHFYQFQCGVNIKSKDKEQGQEGGGWDQETERTVLEKKMNYKIIVFQSIKT